jgi:hypothetical protein
LSDGSVIRLFGNNRIFANFREGEWDLFNDSISNPDVNSGRRWTFKTQSGSTGNFFIYGPGIGEQRNPGVEALMIVNDGGGNYRLRSRGTRSNGLSGSSNLPVVISENGTLGFQSSSIKFKRDVTTLDSQKAIESLKLIRPVTYKSKSVEPGSSSDKTMYGFIAEEVSEVDPKLAIFDVVDGENEPVTVDYARFVVPLVSAFQKQSELIEQLQNKIEQLESQLNTCIEKINSI